ncbi:MAG: HEPN domain-containing protein [Actinobacteria bacterium]|nr:HEPN domain-containing protein [Actinomycetota bacterium]
MQQLLPAESDLREVDVDLAVLTEWSVAGRYPADARDADRGDAERAIRDARVVLNRVSAVIVQTPEG